MKRACLMILMLPVLLVYAGCQGGPTVPESAVPDENQAGLSETNGATHQCLGFCGLSIDTKKSEITVLPLRSTALHVNVTCVLNNTMGVTAAAVPGEADPANGLFVFDITLEHPFPTKPQLSGFDVKGILMTPGTFSISPLVFAGPDETRLENADGYTRWWNPTEFTSPGMFGYTTGNLANAPASALTATVNPYKYFADILLVTDEPLTYMEKVIGEPLDSDMGRGVFRAGNSNTRRYRIRFPMDPGPKVVYGYAVDASWSQPSPNPPGEIPDDFPMVANQPEAYLIYPRVLGNSLYYDSETGNSGGVLRLEALLCDWQGQAVGNIPAQVEVMRAFAPELFIGGIDASLDESEPFGGTYSWDLFPAAKPLHSGETLLAIRAVSQGGPNYDQGVATAPPGKVEAWQVVIVDVQDPECEADDNNDFAEAEPIYFGECRSGVVCKTVDTSDYFVFTVSPGMMPEGEFRVYSDAGPTRVRIYDHDHNLKSDSYFTGKGPDLFMDWKPLPGTYYLEVASEMITDPLPYLVDLRAELVDVVPDSAVEVTPATLFVDPSFVWMHENYAYLAGYFGVWTYDVTDPLNPVQLAYVNTRIGDNACFHYPYIYTAHYAGPNDDDVDLIDVSDPSNPVVHPNVIHFTDSSSFTMCMDSELLCIQKAMTMSTVINVYTYSDDPVHPVYETSIPIIYSADCMALTEVDVFGKYLVVGGPVSIHAYCVEDLLSIDEVVPYPYPSGHPTDIEADAETLYVSYDKGSSDGYFYIMYLEAGLPGFWLFGETDIPGEARALDYDAPFVYVASGTSGFSVVDVSDKANPDCKYSWGLVAESEDIAKSGDTMCVALYRAGMYAFSMPNPMDPTAYKRLEVCNAPNAAIIYGDYLLVSDSSGGYNTVKTIDISEPENAYVAAEKYLLEWPGIMSYYSSKAALYASDPPNNRWKLLDIGDPLNIQILDSVNLPNAPTAIAMTYDAVYIATTLPEVRVYTYSGLHPALAVHFPIPDIARTFVLHEGYMYVVTQPAIEIYSLTDPLNPSYVGSYPVAGNINDATALNGYLYMVTDANIEIADLDDPSAPSYANSLNVGAPGIMYKIAVEWAFAYVGSYYVPPYACSVYPPDSPSVVGPLYTHDPYGMEALLVHEGYLYELSPYQGIHIFDLY
jgi:hypothetical protein